MTKTKATTPLISKYMTDHQHLFAVDTEVLAKKMSNAQIQYEYVESKVNNHYKALFLVLEDAIKLSSQGYELITKSCNMLRDGTFTVAYNKPTELQAKELKEKLAVVNSRYLESLEVIKQGVLNDLTANIRAEKEAEILEKAQQDKQAMEAEIKAFLA
jgi:hypothetical protein